MKKLALIVATTVLSVSVAQADKMICRTAGYEVIELSASSKLQKNFIRLPKITCIQLHKKLPKDLLGLIEKKYKGSGENMVLDIPPSLLDETSKVESILRTETHLPQVERVTENNIGIIDSISIGNIEFKAPTHKAVLQEPILKQRLQK